MNKWFTFFLYLLRNRCLRPVSPTSRLFRALRSSQFLLFH